MTWAELCALEPLALGRAMQRINELVGAETPDGKLMEVAIGEKDPLAALLRATEQGYKLALKRFRRAAPARASGVIQSFRLGALYGRAVASPEQREFRLDAVHRSTIAMRELHATEIAAHYGALSASEWRLAGCLGMGMLQISEASRAECVDLLRDTIAQQVLPGAAAGYIEVVCDGERKGFVAGWRACFEALTGELAADLGASGEPGEPPGTNGEVSA
jgi:hypothetical protein